MMSEHEGQSWCLLCGIEIPPGPDRGDVCRDCYAYAVESVGAPIDEHASHRERLSSLERAMDAVNHSVNQMIAGTLFAIVAVVVVFFFCLCVLGM